MEQGKIRHAVFPPISAGCFCLIVSALLILCVHSGCTLPADVEDVDLNKLKSLIASEKNLVLVDNRSTLEYASGHIPGSIHIPEEHFTSLISLLPARKDTPIVFYCRGAG
ncbi:MAG: rhodanese-like domain-containing protein [Syntrophorhabdus sp.]